MKNLTKFLTVFLLALLGANLQPAWAADKMMYLDISQYTWYDNAYAHYWGGSASAENIQMKKVEGEDHIYYGKIPTGAANILFVRIVSSTWYNQTYDWNNFGDINYFKLTSQSDKMGMSSGTYVPKMKSLSLANNGTTTLSGSGTQSDPYIIAAGATIKVKATAALQVDDSNPTFKYKYSVDGAVVQDYGSGNNTYQFTAGTEAHTYAVTVRAYATYNSTDNTAIDASNTIYFKIATYTGLTIADNGAPSMTAASTLSANQVVQGQSVTITKGTPATGYIFSSYTPTNGSITDDNFTPNANGASVTVNWVGRNTTVTLDDQGGSDGSGTVTATYGSAMPSASKPSKTGYTFGGYYDQTGGAGTQYYDNMPTSAHVWDKDVSEATLYAHWTAKQTTITLDGNGATTAGTPTKITATYGQPLPAQLESFTAPEKDGFNFKGYYSATSGGTQYYNNAGARVYDGTWDNEAATATFYAQWENAATYSLTVNVNPSAAFTAHSESVENITLGQSYNISATLADKGYTWTGWTYSGDGIASFADASALSTTVTVNNGSVTVTANAEAKTTTLTLHSLKGTPTEQTIIATYDQTFPQDQGYTKPTCPGYTFNGYFITEQSDPDGTKGTQIIKTDASGAFVSSYSGWIKSGGIWAKEDAAKDLYAHWTATKSNKLTLSKNFKTTTTHTGSDGEAWITFDATAFTDYAAATSSTGFTLLGYVLENNGTTMIADAEGNFLKNVEGYTDENGKWINPTFPAGTIYAQWEEALTTLTIAANEPTWGTLKYNNLVTGIEWGMTETVGVDKASKNIIATAKTGYIFTGWTIAAGDEDKITYTDGTTIGSIVVNGTGIANSTATIQANFIEDLSSNWYVRGDSPFCGWTTDANCMLKKETGHSTSNDVYYTVTLSANTNVAFKIWDNTNSGSYYGASTDGGNYWINSTSGQIQLNPGDNYHNLEIRGTVAGDYLIHFNTSTKKVEVTWPEKYFIAGNTQLTGKNWDVQGTEMTNRSYTFTNLAAGQDYRFRITDGTWDHTWGYTDLATGSDANFATLENNNVHFTLTTAGDVTISIDSDKKVYVTTTGTFGEYRYTLWKIGGMKSDNWSDRVFMKKSGELDQSVAYYEVELTKGDYEFKIKNPSGTYLGNEGEITGNVTNWEFYQYYSDEQTLKPNCCLKATVVGTYIFKLDFSNASAPKVSVTYPLGEGYTATITTEGAGKVQKDGVDVTEVPLYEVYGTVLTAVPNDGYHFVGWTTTGNVFIDSNNKSTDSPAYFYATGTGTIKATFAKNPTIYFNNTMSKTWGADKMYVYFYSTDYWDESEYGSGSENILAGPYEMTQIPKTNIWEYTYDPTAAPFNRTNIKGVVFSDEEMVNYQHFQNCSATYRMDYSNGCANMFVLNPQQDAVLKNVSAKYYKKGFWRNYNSTTSKMYLNIWDCDGNKGIGSYELLTDAAGNEAFSTTVELSSNKRYNLYVGNCTGSNFSQKVDITSENYTGFDLYEYESIDDKSQLAYLTTKSSGDYVFTLTFDDAHMLFSVEYPIMLDDYRVKIGTPTRYSNIIRSDQESGTISMYLNEGTNTFTYDKVTNVNVNPIVWTEDGTINVNVEKAGVYTMTLHKNKTIDNVKPYTGEYYVRTDCAQGGWQEYKTNDNNLMRFTDRNPKFVNNPSEGFNYYYCRWCANASSNVRFVVANEINACISDTMKADTWLDNDEFLKGMANIRFGWNSNTNALSRAYISGAYDEEKYMQIRSNNSKLFEYPKVGESSYTEITAKSFADENDWTYTMDVYADGGAQVAVSAYYNNKYQFFVGTGNGLDGTVSTAETLLKAGSKQHLRLVYDFKTDRLISGWTPEGDITETIILDADMLLVREAQQSAAQINITTAGVEIQEIKTIYSVLQLNRDKMLSETDGILASGHLYENAIYWISFPFDVAVNDIFGIDGYGTKWVIQYYDGAERARKGFFKETETFWTYLGINDTIHANVGYALCLDPDFFDDADDDIWANNRQSVSFYFPSADRNLKIVGNGTKTVPVPQHECKIDRTFADGKKNHKITDTDWNVIGSPAFQDLKGTDEMCTMQALYQWNPATNGYNVATVNGFDFQTTHAYLVQFRGEINWQNASVINPTVAPTPRYAYADEKNYTVELQFYYGSQWDRTYVALKDEAKADFVLNEDLTKMTNAGQPNIYSYAGAYDVAYNATTFENQMVNLGVIARKNGTYTFSMPKEFSGTAKLIDLVEGITTDLNVSNYSVDLNKGTYNDRFQLLLEVEAKAPTSIEADGQKGREADGKTLKLLRNGNIYLINAGRVYNVLGVEE